MDEVKMLREKYNVLVKRVIYLEGIIKEYETKSNDLIKTSTEAYKNVKLAQIVIDQQKERIKTLENQLELIRTGVGK